MAIECDGYSHQIVEVWEKDNKKTKRLKELGIEVLRFSDEQILKDTDNVLRVIEDYIERFENKNTHP